MKSRINNWTTITLITVLLAASGYHCSTSRKAADQESVQIIKTNVNGKGMDITLQFKKGESHNHPLMAIWIEDTSGNYIETLYVAESIGKGIFQHGDRSRGFWKEGPIRRPAALPYWAHKRGIQAPDGYYLPTPEDPMPDAVTGPTPPGDFTLESRATSNLPDEFFVLLEINQSWDWNEYWTNNKYPEDINYKTSSQPSLVFAAKISREAGADQVLMQAIGHGHYSGADGSLNEDISTLTTALDIVESVVLTITP